MWDLPDLPLALVMEEILEWEKKPGQEKDTERETNTSDKESDRSGGGSNSPPSSFPCRRADSPRGGGAAHLFKSFTASASAFSIASFAAGHNCFSIVLVSGGVSSDR